MLGAGMAGLVTARVLADRYAQVVVVERNIVVGVTGPRAGVPQGHHAHAMFMRVAGLIDPPGALMRPGFVRRVLRLSRDRATGPAAGSPTVFDPTDQLERAAS